VLAIAFAGVGLAARDAQPGDTLWALTKVLYSEHARSIEAAEAVKDDLREAKDALTEGDIDEAKSKLQDAHATLPTVLPDDGQRDLLAEHNSLLAQLPGNPSDQAGSPPSPDPSTQPGAGGPGSGDNSGSSTDSSPPSPATDPSTDTTPPEDTTSSSPPTTEETSREGGGGSGTGTSGQSEGDATANIEGATPGEAGP